MRWPIMKRADDTTYKSEHGKEVAPKAPKRRSADSDDVVVHFPGGQQGSKPFDWVVPDLEASSLEARPHDSGKKAERQIATWELKDKGKNVEGGKVILRYNEGICPG